MRSDDKFKTKQFTSTVALEVDAGSATCECVNFVEVTYSLFLEFKIGAAPQNAIF